MEPREGRLSILDDDAETLEPQKHRRNNTSTVEGLCGFRTTLFYTIVN